MKQGKARTHATVGIPGRGDEDKPSRQQDFCFIEEIDAAAFNQGNPRPLYGIFLFSGEGNIMVDFTEYQVDGNIVLFATPYQFINILARLQLRITSLWFHADYYCIEYHKKEVACNGLLFNNIYSPPDIVLEDGDYIEMQAIFGKLQQELNCTGNYSHAVARTYLQLILALSSKAKMASFQAPGESPVFHPILKFKDLLERHYIRERRPSYYAAQLGISPNTFSKKCKAHFHKSPSTLIQERVILEAKKLIHLTFKNMKEIAATLNFEDENYFSRYFKKYTGIAPSAFRESVGISEVAYSSM